MILNKAIYNLYQYLRNNASLLFICMFIGVMHLLYQGYEFGIGNHSIQIPLLKSYFHSELYPNDPMVATRSHYITFYFVFFAAIERTFGHLELIFFASQIITEILFFIAIYHFAYVVFKEQGDVDRMSPDSPIYYKILSHSSTNFSVFLLNRLQRIAKI